MNTHEQWHLLSAYLDGELSADEGAALEGHLAGCGPCRRELESLSRLKGMAAAAPRRQLPPAVLAELEARLRDRPWWRRIPSWMRAPSVWMPAGASALAALCLGLWFGLRAAPAEEYLPLEPLLAAHARYSADRLLPDGDRDAADFSAHLVAYHEEK